MGTHLEPAREPSLVHLASRQDQKVHPAYLCPNLLPSPPRTSKTQLLRDPPQLPEPSACVATVQCLDPNATVKCWNATTKDLKCCNKDPTKQNKYFLKINKGSDTFLRPFLTAQRLCFPQTFPLYRLQDMIKI